MTRRSDMMLEDLVGCTHEPETPVCDDDGTEILYWICRCGQRCSKKPAGQVLFDDDNVAQCVPPSEEKP